MRSVEIKLQFASKTVFGRGSDPVPARGALVSSRSVPKGAMFSPPELVPPDLDQSYALCVDPCEPRITQMKSGETDVNVSWTDSVDVRLCVNVANRFYVEYRRSEGHFLFACYFTMKFL